MMKILTLLQLTSIKPNEVVRSILIRKVNPNNTYLTDRIRLAMEVTDCPIAYISILGSKSQHIITTEGLMKIPIIKDQNPCPIKQNNTASTIIANGSKDSLVNHLKVSHKDFNFYADFSLLNLNNNSIGTICIADRELKVLGEESTKILKMIAEGIGSKFNTSEALIDIIKEINQNCKTADLVEVLINRKNRKLTSEEKQYLNILGITQNTPGSKTKGRANERPNSWYQNG